MENNCLVTNLKGVVNDQTLPKMFELKVPFKTKSGVTTTTIVAGGSAPFDVFEADGTPVVQNQTANYTLRLSYDGYIVFKDARLITQLGIAKCDLSNIKFIDFGDITFPNRSSIFSCYGSNFSDDIANFVKYCPTARICTFNDNDIYGNADCLIKNGALAVPGMKQIIINNNPRLKIHRSTYNTLKSLLGDDKVTFSDSQILEDE